MSAIKHHDIIPFGLYKGEKYLTLNWDARADYCQMLLDLPTQLKPELYEYITKNGANKKKYPDFVIKREDSKNWRIKSTKGKDVKE